MFAFPGETGRLSASARADEDAGDRRGRPGLGHARSRAPQSAARRAHASRVRQSDHERSRAGLSALRPLRAGPAGPHARHRGPRRRFLLPDRDATRRRVLASRRRRRSALHADDVARSGRGRGRGAAAPARSHAIGQFPEVATVFGKVGRADTATDPAPYSMVETTIRLRPHSKWPLEPRTRWYTSWAPGWLKRPLGVVWPEQTPETMSELVAKLDAAIHSARLDERLTAPARARMDMMSTNGVRTPVGIRIVAATPERLDALGAALQAWATQLPGTRSAAFEALGGEPWLSFHADPAALALHDVDPALVQSTTDLMTTGGQVGEVELSVKGYASRRSSGHEHGTGGAYEHEHEHMDPEARAEMEPQSKPYRVRVATDMSMKREDADALREVTLRSSTEPPVPLALLGHPSYVTPARDDPHLEGKELVALRVRRPERGHGRRRPTYAPARRRSKRLQERRREATRRQGLRQVRPAGATWRAHRMDGTVRAPGFGRAAPSRGSCRSWPSRWWVSCSSSSERGLTEEALIVLVSVPFALVGSFWTLFLLHYPLSAPVWVGLLSTIGLAMQTGVVMVVYIDEAFHRRVREGRVHDRGDIVAAHAEGTVQRLRPKIMTITTMAAGLLPLLWAEGAGAEIMRRVAAPMIGGLVTSAFLTLEVLPVLYTLWRQHQLRRASSPWRFRSRPSWAPCLRGPANEALRRGGSRVRRGLLRRPGLCLSHASLTSRATLPAAVRSVTWRSVPRPSRARFSWGSGVRPSNVPFKGRML